MMPTAAGFDARSGSRSPRLMGGRKVASSSAAASRGCRLGPVNTTTRERSEHMLPPELQRARSDLALVEPPEFQPGDHDAHHREPGRAAEIDHQCPLQSGTFEARQDEANIFGDIAALVRRDVAERARPAILLEQPAPPVDLVDASRVDEGRIR